MKRIHLISNLGDTTKTSKLQHLYETLDHKLMVKMTTQRTSQKFQKNLPKIKFPQRTSQAFENSNNMCIQVMINLEN